MFERRLKVLLVCLALVSLVLIARAFTVQVIGRARWEEESARVMADERPLATSRGRILDVKGRELAVDQPCIDVCVDYQAVAFFHTLKSLNKSALERLAKDAEFAKQDEDTRKRRTITMISTLVREESESTLKWLRNIARQRVRRQYDNYESLPFDQKVRLRDSAVCAVIADLDAMWPVLARVSTQSIEDIDELRRQIVRRVETRRRIVWYNKYERAVKNQQDRAGDTWYSWLLGDSAGSVNIDKFDVTVAEQLQKHTIIPNVEYAIRNQLGKEIEKYPGLALQASVVRHYPYQQAGCHVIGTLRAVEPKELVDRETLAKQTLEERLRNYLASDQVGREGLEALAEESLHGARGVQIEGGDGEIVREIKPVPGKDVRSTIDIVLQSTIEEAFKHVAFKPNREAETEHLEMLGAAVVIDVPTGEVRAMVSYPTFDLNQYNELYAQLVQDAINRPLTNRATQVALEPGSTVKPLVGLGAITDGLFGVHDTIECDGFLHIGNTKYSYGRCWTESLFKDGIGRHHAVPSAAPHANGFLTFSDALQRSCNVFHEVLGDRLGVEGLSRWFDKFGLGRPTGVGLPERSGLLPNDFEGPAMLQRSVGWFAAIGQGHLAATPIQMGNVAATLARNGIWKRPTLVARTVDDAAIDLRINREALAEARRGMIEVVNTPAGTGTDARIDLFLVAGKTGSAQSAPLRVPRQENGKPVLDARGRVIWDTIPIGKIGKPNPKAPWYRAIGDTEEKVASHAWMIGYAPANNPKIAFAVMVEYGGGGGTAAGSVVKRLLEACIEQGYLPGK